MRWLAFVCLFAVQAFADAFHEGQTLVQGNTKMDDIGKSGIAISENPPEVELNDDSKLARAKESAQHHNEVFQMIKAGNKQRESYTIEVELPDMERTAQEAGHATDGALGVKDTSRHKTGDILYKTCIKSGEEYTKTCRRQRMIEIKITPEVLARHPKSCPGHKRFVQWPYGSQLGVYRQQEEHYKCNGCVEGSLYVSQAKKVDITRDDWVGCEALERLHDRGEADVISEVMGPKDETRMINGEPITKDYWETTRTYAFNTSRCDTCEPLKALGCRQHDSVCEEYVEGMGGARICKRFKVTYACPISQGSVVSKRPDMEAFMPPVQTGVANGNMYQALSQMEAMRQMSKHMEGGEHNLRIFRGQDNRCSINFGGAFKNCCTSEGGFGTRMHIATSCSADEKKLAEARSKKLCQFVGSRVKKKVLGVVVSKENVFCCYPTKLGLAIQRGARGQLGRDFGSAESPSCEGLSPDELSRVDFSQIDLSDTFADIAASAQKMEREIKTDLKQKQRHFERPETYAFTKENQPKHKRIDEKGVTHDIVY